MSLLRICALEGCKGPVTRSNQDYCCKQHRQLAYVHKKRRQDPEMGSGTCKASTHAQVSFADTRASKGTAYTHPHPAPVQTAAKPCARRGYPSGIFEVRDQQGVPVFFDIEGCRLLRVHGPRAVSEIELSMQRLVLADDLPVDIELIRPAAPFRFYRKAGE